MFWLLPFRYAAVFLEALAPSIVLKCLGKKIDLPSKNHLGTGYPPVNEAAIMIPRIVWPGYVNSSSQCQRWLFAPSCSSTLNSQFLQWDLNGQKEKKLGELAFQMEGGATFSLGGCNGLKFGFNSWRGGEGRFQTRLCPFAVRRMENELFCPTQVKKQQLHHRRFITYWWFTCDGCQYCAIVQLPPESKHGFSGCNNTETSRF